jgi:hypothetical protein
MIILFFVIANPSNSAEHISDTDRLFQSATRAVKDGNYSLAIKNFQKLALISEHDAQYNLAVLLKAGKGSTKKYTDSLYWSWLAYLGGIEAAEDFSEDLYDMIPEKETEVIRNKVKEYLTIRVEGGDKQALMQLASFFLIILPEKDYLSAYRWFTVAAAVGLTGAVDARDNAENELSSEDIVSEQLKAETIFTELPESIKNEIK